MAVTRTTLLERAGGLCETAALTMISGVWRTCAFSEISARFAALPRKRRISIVTAVLGLLFLLAVFAAQFGWVGMLIYWMAVILIAR